MNLLGIIAEYNPFHNGHKYHIEKSNEDLNPDATVVVMSGNFTQRGNCACYDKWTRTKCALLNGADLVIELPVTFATGSAERFATGSVYLLDKIGVKNISFGSESPLSELQAIADKLISDELVINSSSEVPFHIARQKAIDDSEILSKPNNILAIEYLKALKVLNSCITPHRIERYAVGYNDLFTNDGFASATKVRELINNKNTYKDVIPQNVFEIISNSKFVNDEAVFNSIKYSIISKTPEELSTYAHIREGIENRIYKSTFGASSLDGLIKEIKSKRYTYTTISRMLVSILLGIKKENLSDYPGYIRVLGLNDKGALALKYIKSNCELPIITKISSAIENLSPSALKELKTDIIASDIYYTCADITTSASPDFINSPIKI